MDILIFSQFFWPEVRTAPTNLFNLASDLVGKGYNVTVLTGFPNHPFGKIYKGYRMNLWSIEKVNGIRILRIPLYPDHSTSVLKRILNFLSFSISASTIGFYILRKFNFDIILSYLPPLTISFPTFLFKYFHNAKVVYWITDLWPENLLAAGAKLSKPALNLIYKIENWTYSQGNKICLNSPGYINNLLSKGVKRSQLELIMDSVDENILFPSEYDIDLAEKYGISNKFNFMYAGNIGNVQALDIFIEVADSLKKFTKIQIIFIGDGNGLEGLKTMVKELKLKNITFISRKPFEEMYRFFSIADVLFLHLSDHPVFKNQIPSKIGAYMACAKPVLCALDGASKEFIDKTKTGLTCKPNNRNEIANTMIKFFKMGNKKIKAMEKNSKLTCDTYFTRERQSKAFQDVFKQLLHKN